MADQSIAVGMRKNNTKLTKYYPKENTMQIRFQNLLEYKDGSISGPMSPVLGAQEFCKLADITMHGLTRVWIHQVRLTYHFLTTQNRSNNHESVHHIHSQRMVPIN